jgi:hypothetical protein
MAKIDYKRRGLREAIAEMAKPHITASGRAGMKMLVKSEKSHQRLTRVHTHRPI